MNGMVAVEAPVKQDNGFVLVFDCDGNLLAEYEAGALPDMVTFTPDGTRILCANEGDARDYDGYSEEARVGDLALDPTIFPNRQDLQAEENLGRLTTTLANGDIDNDENGFFKKRSDDKGPEPEGLCLGEVDGRTYAFIGLERIGGIVTYDVTDPMNPTFVQYLNNRDFDGDPEEETAGDLGPEGLQFVPAESNPAGIPLLLVAHEVSATLTMWSISSIGLATDADEAAAPAPGGTLSPASPNPFQGSTSIRFEMPRAGQVQVEIFDVQGRSVCSLYEGRAEAGNHQLMWDGRDGNGSSVAPGVCFTRMQSEGSIQVRKVQVL